MLGIIDWGIGGVSIYKLIKKRRPKTSVIYFSDTGVTPYGKMSRKVLVTRLDNVIEFLKSRGMTHLVIGCNAASTAIPFLKNHDIPIEGIIDSAVATAAKSHPKKLGLIGGRRTVLSGVYRKAFACRKIKVKQRVAQPLSALIESGDLTSDKLRAESRRILSPLKNRSHILLACTHYPAISTVLAEHVSSDTVLIDPADDLVEEILKWHLKPGKDTFLTTGNATTMKKAAKAAFGVTIKDVSRVKI